ncbi:hypothetical protein [Polyangium mundeleinium]|uniref:Rad50/SbcC-type AAA domain-containing protein n=1 Tax=Polyangium mundeleinium TaxID=2995306 RepID=A0ABT5ERJ7_9BACT|nr:hypothetical protein [Polyangium mundeleinium]MDC0744452.1 hypothetical protein [Polyangium mundeleinium]
MRFRVEHLGPLREAEIDIGKDLIVLTGPNNTGKTYLAWSVYGVHRLRGRSEAFQGGPLDACMKSVEASDTHALDLSSLPVDWNSVFERVTRLVKSELSRVFAAAPEAFEQTKVSLSDAAPAAADMTLKLGEFRDLLASIDSPPHREAMLLGFQLGLAHRLWETQFPHCILFPA